MELIGLMAIWAVFIFFEMPRKKSLYSELQAEGGFVIKVLLHCDQDKIYFESLTGKLTAAIDGKWITINFPVDECMIAVPPACTA